MAGSSNLQAFYGALAALFAVMLLSTMSEHPLFPLQTDNAEWATAWLFTTCVDYYVRLF